MHDQPHPAVPAHITESLEASLRDIEAGDLYDAAGVHAEAQKMLADYERSQTVLAKSRAAKGTRAA